jgi:hypothetical protein
MNGLEREPLRIINGFGALRMTLDKESFPFKKF